MAHRTITSTIGTLLIAGLAHAQSTSEVIIEIDRPVLAPGESTTVRLWAGYDSTRDFAMGGIATSLLADSGGVEIGAPWSEVSLVGRMAGPGSTRGTPEAGGYAGIIGFQFHWWQEPADTDRSDPIAFWEATFTAPADAGAFTIDLSTRTTAFTAYPFEWSSRTESRFDGLTEGAGRIIVVPAPAGLAPLALAALLGPTARRRRRGGPAARGAGRGSE